MKNRKNLSVIGCIFSKDRQEILLVKRRDVPVWTLPGGGIEQGETLEQAIQREIHEETGYNVIIDRLVGQYFPINKLTRETYLFEATIIGGTTMCNSETKEIRFFSVMKLPKYLPPPYDEWIIEAHQKKDTIIRRKLSSITYRLMLKGLMKHPLCMIRFLLSRIGIYLNT